MGFAAHADGVNLAFLIRVVNTEYVRVNVVCPGFKIKVKSDQDESFSEKFESSAPFLQKIRES